MCDQVPDEPVPETSALCDELGVDVLPTLQFWRNGSKLWEHRGVDGRCGREDKPTGRHVGLLSVAE